MNLFDLIEEVISENSSLGFGEGTPPKDKLGKKQVVSLEEEADESEEGAEELEEMSAMGAGAVEGGGISREEFVEELKLREFIQKGIKRIKDKKNKEILEEEKLRSFIRSMIKEASTPDVSPTPNRATGINVLEELLKKIIPVLETDYKTLTTNPEQRQSFRAHILNAAENTLRPAMVNDSATDAEVLDEPGLNQLQELDNSIDIDIEDDDDFISIESEKEKEKDPVQEFGLEGENETGRNMAYQSFKKIEANILDSYSLLSDVEDQELFYTYLLTNLKLYFDKFEEDLAANVDEPSTEENEEATAEEGEEELAAEEPAEDELGAEEL